jgi:hypothetical protein
MHQGSGNMAIGSESVTVTENITECKQAQQVFMRTKGKIKDVSQYGNRLEFTKVTPGLELNIKYTLDCSELVGE